MQGQLSRVIKRAIIKSHMSVSQTTLNMLAEFAQQMHDHKSPRCDSLLAGNCSTLFISISFYFSLRFIQADVAEFVLMKFIVRHCKVSSRQHCIPFFKNINVFNAQNLHLESNSVSNISSADFQLTIKS